jgi:carbonic anhydrase
MKKLIRGIVDFRKNVRPGVKDLFAHLALGQKPDTLFIACSDSRVVPNLFASSDPGDLFVVRNVGNLVPRYSATDPLPGSDSEAAAIGFGLRVLPVTDIIVCGHSECGAMQALLHAQSDRGAPEEVPHIGNWLRHGEASLRRLDAAVTPSDARLERHNRLSRLNVLEQIEHLKTYPLVAERIAAGKLRLHGWWFDIKEADVYAYGAEDGGFRLIDEDYARLLLKRLEGTEAAGA